MAFGACEICGDASWTASYSGLIRDGAFGGPRIEAKIARCGGCGADRLEESACHDDAIYLGEQYRRMIGESSSVAGFMIEHEELQLSRLPHALAHMHRGARIADVGCAAGGFLEHIRDMAGTIVAIDPCADYHPSLRARGYEVFGSTADAIASAGGTIERAFCLGVIEHVREPRRMLEEINALLIKGGMALVATANRKDVLMSLLPDVYPSFFYRRVHRWYWDQDSFRRMCELAGLAVADYRCGHRFGLSNALAWLRDHRPTGNRPLPGISDPALDAAWVAHLVQSDQGDQLYFWLRKR